MKVDLGIWGKLTRVIIVLIVTAVLLGVAVFYWPVLQQNERMRKVVLQLDTQLAQEEATARQLRGSIDSLRNDPRSVERLAREHGFAKPGETVFRFESPSTAAARQLQ